MKKYFLLALLTFCMAIAKGQVLLNEPFNYTPDPVLGLAAQSSSAWLIVNTGDSILIDNGSLSYTGLSASTGNKIKFDNAGTDYYRIFANQTTGTIYSSFILNVSALGTMNTTGSYFAGFIQSASTSLYGATVWTRLSTTAGKYNVGISTRSNSAISWLANDLDPATPNFIVFAYVFNPGAGDDVAKIWLNTTAIGSTEPAAGATAVAGTDLTSVERFLLRQATNTTTPFIEMDEIRVGTTWASVTPSSVATPSLTIATSLSAFGNTCINTEAGPNSFTISGTNLTTADVTVGALSGFTYSTTAGGTYTSTLSITQAGGAFSQTVFVKFAPTAVQSYDGNIPVAGGGVSTAVNVAASGAGVNTAPVVTSGSASAITQVSATVSGTITNTGCSAITAYGIEYSTTAGFANGTGTAVASSNLSAGNFSSALTGLVTATTYYYHAWATNSAGTSYGTEGTFTTASPDPQILVSSLAGFGNVCLNTTAGPGSFTITGTNLTAADITVAALNGFTYSTSSAGTYTSSLTLTQTGGSYSQEIFVKFAPVALQSYNGNITVNGGGVSAPVDVAATGAGVNTQASLTTGAATSITYNSASIAGTITATGCTSVTAYGFEYSTTNNFTPGSGTVVAASNLNAGAFSAALSGLSPVTVYYYRSFATNGGGTAYGVQQSFTTAPVPIALTATSLTGFGPACINSSVGPNSFTINGAFLTTANVNVGPLTGYTFSTTSGGTYTSSLSLTQPGGTYSQVVYVKFNPTAVQTYNGNIPVSGGGFGPTVNVAVTGSGVNTTATLITGTAANITTQSALVAGQVITEGCSPITSYGIEWSNINGFANGTGTPVAGTSISSGNFTVPLNGLVQGATYYYKSYAINNGGTAYGTQQSFTVASIGNGFRLYPNPVERGTAMRITVKDIQPGYYGLMLFNSAGEKVYQWNMNIQSTFINQTFTVPATLQHGVYRAYLVNDKKEFEVITVLVL